MFDRPKEQAPAAEPPRWRRTHRNGLLALAFIAPLAVIGVDVFFIAKGSSLRAVSGKGAASSSALAAPALAVPALNVSAPSLAPLGDVAPPSQVPEVGGPVFHEDSDDDRAPPKPAVAKHFASVQEAAEGSCTTASVEGLSRQIIEQARCISPGLVVALPARPNLVLGPHVFPYLQTKASEHLLRVLRAHPNTTMTVNSALRTVAQQYLVWRWSANKRCGVELATPPGESNHEIGLALDIAEQAAWRPALESEAFHWLGATDRVHFDYQAPTAHARSTTDVLAFQKLWNKNHKTDPLVETGHYDEATERRLKSAPTDGFATGASCGKK